MPGFWRKGLRGLERLDTRAMIGRLSAGGMCFSVGDGLERELIFCVTEEGDYDEEKKIWSL